MLKTFPIDFIRQALEQTLYEEHFNNPYFFGGKNQVVLRLWQAYEGDFAIRKAYHSALSAFCKMWRMPAYVYGLCTPAGV